MAIDSAVPRREEAHAPISGGYPGAAPGGAPFPLCSAHAPIAAFRSLKLAAHSHCSTFRSGPAWPCFKLSCSHIVGLLYRKIGRCLTGPM